MKKISDALAEILSPTSPLYYAFRQRLLNLSETARYLSPIIAARTKKEVGNSAILMALSRLLVRTTPLAHPQSASQPFKISTLTIHADLVVVTILKSATTQRSVHTLTTKLQRRGSYLTVTEGISEITLIFAKEHLPEVKTSLATEHPRVSKEVASLSITFPPKYLTTPGFLAEVLQRLALQRINIVELSSTSTELILYLTPADVQLAAETLYQSFM